MLSDSYREINPGKKIIKKIYVWVALLLFGRAFQAGYKADREIKAEFDALPADYLFDLCVEPSGPHMLVGKKKNGKVKYFGSRMKNGMKPALSMKVKNIEAAMQMFTFMESTTTANARNRIVVEGEIKYALAMVRVMNLLEVYLLPKPAAKLGVKRYPKWSQMNPFRKHLGRIQLYLRLITG